MGSLGRKTGLSVLERRCKECGELLWGIGFFCPECGNEFPSIDSERSSRGDREDFERSAKAFCISSDGHIFQSNFCPHSINFCTFCGEVFRAAQ